MANPKEMDAAEDKAGNEVQFPIPKGYKPPASSEGGKTFTAVATFRVDDDDDADNENGPMLCLVKIEGVPVSMEASKEESEEQEPQTSKALMGALQANATNASQGAPAAVAY
jgi:hypothetical protein